MADQPEQNVSPSNADTSISSNLPPPPPSNATVNQLTGTGSIPTSRSSGASGGAQANNPVNSTANMSAEMMSLDSLMIQPQQNSGASSNVNTGGAASSAVSAAGRT